MVHRGKSKRVVSGVSVVEFEKRGQHYFKIIVSDMTSNQHCIEKIIGVPVAISNDINHASDHAYKYWNHLGYDIHSVHHIKTT